MTERKMPMVYDSELRRWVAEGKTEWYSLHCGEFIRLHVGSHRLDGRLKLGKTWYVIVDNVPIGLIEGRRYLVTIEL